MTEKNKNTVAFRTKPDVLKLLEEAQRVSGSDKTEIIENCIRRAVEAVVIEEVRRKSEEAERAKEALKTYKPKPQI